MHENWVQPSSCPSGLWWKLHRAPAYKDGCGSVEPIRSISTGILISCYSLLQFTISKTFWWFHSNYKNTTTCHWQVVKEVVSDIQMKSNRFLKEKKDSYWENLTSFLNFEVPVLGTPCTICQRYHASGYFSCHLQCKITKDVDCVLEPVNLKSYRITGHLI